jgi:hypothetical protein
MQTSSSGRVAYSRSTRSAPSPAASVRPAARACSAPTTISKAPTPRRRCASSTSCSTPARSKAARSASFRTRPGSISSTKTARCARNCPRSRSSSTASSRCASRCRTRSSPLSSNCSRPGSRRRSRRQLRHRRRDADGRDLRHRRAAHGAHPCRERRRNALLPGAAQRPQSPPAPRRGPGAARAAGGRLLINEQSHRAAVQVPAASLMNDDGRVEPRTRLIRPMA